MATLVAFVRCLEATAQDEALEVLEMLPHDLFAHATQAYTKARLRTLKDLDQAAIVLVKACRPLLDPALPDGKLRAKVFGKIPRAELAQPDARTSRRKNMRRLPDEEDEVAPTNLSVVLAKGGGAVAQIWV